MRRIFLIVILFFSFFSSPKAEEQQPQTLMFSFGSHNSEPYIILNDSNATDNNVTNNSVSKNKVVGGIIWDIAQELANELNTTASFINIPRKRQARHLENGKTDVILISNPVWLGNKDKLIWSNSLFIDRDLLVSLTASPLRLNAKKDLYGLNLGTIRGYKYLLIDEDIAKNHIIRHDVRELNSNIEKLLLSRIDAFIDSSILINYRLSKRQDASRFRISPLKIKPHYIYAAISPKSHVASQKIVAALDKLKNNGVIEAILHKYK